MSQPFVGEIRMFAGTYAPIDWAFCDGTLLLIADNNVLYALIGTTYGGDGLTTFALPDLRGRVPVDAGNGFVVGQSGGAETVTLTVPQLPIHNHVPQAQSGTGTQAGPAGGVWAASGLNPYSTSSPAAAMDPGAIGLAGGSHPHQNMMPFLAVNFILSLTGVFPSH